MDQLERPADWLRGLLDLCVLAVIGRGPTYGYRITVALAQAGLGEIKGGTLYPLLARVERGGLVDTHWEAGDGGPGRKFYELTDTGRRQLAELTQLWHGFQSDIDRVVNVTRSSHARAVVTGEEES
jgi:PadR family transcriptional regulator PadR